MGSHNLTMLGSRRLATKAFGLSCSYRWALIALCAAAGVAASICLVVVLMHREHRRALAEFHLASERQAEQVYRTADDIVTSVLVLRAFFAGSEVVEPDEFRVFTDTLPQATPAGVRFGWAPRQDGPDGESFRVRYVTEAGPPLAGVGWDPCSEPACREAIERAQALGTTVASAPFTPSSGESPMVLLASPLENGELRGIVFGVFSPAAVLESAMLAEHAKEMVVEVYDAQPAASRILMARHGLEGIGWKPAGTADAAVQQAFGCSFAVCGRTWLTETRPTRPAWARYCGWLPWIAGVAGLLLTAAGVGILTLLAVQTARVERLVATRTAEVKQSEEQLRSITTAALDAVVMITPDGTVAHWNPAAERILGYRQSEVL
ncbi:MAG: CHASE domain-containing protein, partial [Patescibacteria group bacterium]|nr:CHASE domain-containing protein [Patescibacteria group bacterium]